VSHFPLTTAALCEDCHEIGNNLRQCACCGSRSLLALAPVLDRQEIKEPADYDVEQTIYELERTMR
jgi:hypothetical protein